MNALNISVWKHNLNNNNKYICMPYTSKHIAGNALLCEEFRLNYVDSKQETYKHTQKYNQSM